MARGTGDADEGSPGGERLDAGDPSGTLVPMTTGPGPAGHIGFSTGRGYLWGDDLRPAHPDAVLTDWTGAWRREVWGPAGGGGGGSGVSTFGYLGRQPIIYVARCEHCGARIAFSPRARQWWHWSSGGMHCPDPLEVAIPGAVVAGARWLAEPAKDSARSVAENDVDAWA